MTDIKKTFCKKDIISSCDQNKNPTEQKNCTYYEKATKAERCLWLTFDKFCTSTDAQYNTKNI